MGERKKELSSDALGLSDADSNSARHAPRVIDSSEIVSEVCFFASLGTEY